MCVGVVGYERVVCRSDGCDNLYCIFEYVEKKKKGKCES